jgi:hypothetical protein
MLCRTGCGRSVDIHARVCTRCSRPLNPLIGVLMSACVTILPGGAVSAQDVVSAGESIEYPVVVLAPEPPQAASSSPSYRVVERNALARHSSGDTARAIVVLTPLLRTAAPADAASARLHLGYMERKLGKRDEARQYFQEAAGIPPGLNDAVRGEAALRGANTWVRRPRCN